MAEYIKREEAMYIAFKSPFFSDSLMEEIDNIPAADVAPVVHGRWISKNPHGYEWTFVCSNCDYVDGYPFNDRHKYCPNCGAMMDLEV